MLQYECNDKLYSVKDVQNNVRDYVKMITAGKCAKHRNWSN